MTVRKIDKYIYIEREGERERQREREKEKMSDKKTTRMTTSISSEARRNQTSILIRGQEKSHFPLNLTDIHTERHTYKQTYIHTDGRSLAFIE